MSTYVRARTKAGANIHFSTERSDDGKPVGVSSRIGGVDETIEIAFKDQIAPFVDMVDDIKQVSSDQFDGELTLWLRMDPDQGLVAVKDGAHITLTLKWSANDG